MTKRHFIRLADALRSNKIKGRALEVIVQWCKAENPAFLEGRFRDYVAGKCGPNGGKK